LPGDTWSRVADLPLPAEEGCALTSCADFIYGLFGAWETGFWRYAPLVSGGGARLAAATTERGGVLGVARKRLDVTPEPAREFADVRWLVKDPGNVAVRVFDNTGRVVRTIQSGYQTAGLHTARWDGTCDNGKRAASGVFFCTLDEPGFRKTIKLTRIAR
jgi:hypothetical protein